MLKSQKYEINHALLLSSPKIKDVWDDWEKDIEEDNDLMTRVSPLLSSSILESIASAWITLKCFKKQS